MTAANGATATPDLDERLAVLSALLARQYPEWAARDLSVAGAGLNFLVCRAATATFGTVALRVPWVRTLVNDTDGTLEARRLLQQEAALGRYLRAHGLPTPAIYVLHLGDDGDDFLASEFVTGDGSSPDGRAFGRLIRALHTIDPPDLALIEGGDLPCHARIAMRLSDRATALARLTGTALSLPDEATIAAILAPRAGAQSVLHMDARPANLFTHDRSIVAIADWGNALIGDPALELARIAEFGHLGADFLAGYGDDPLAALPAPIATLYRLDTAVTLALVFLAEAPDPVAAERFVARSRALAAAL